MKTRGVIPVITVGAIVVLFTVAAFFLLEIDQNALNIWALAFLLLSECVAFGGLAAIRIAGGAHSPVFLRAGVSSALSLYLIATIICTLFTRSFEDKLNKFILVEIAIFAIFVIAVISIYTFSRGIKSQNDEDVKKVGSNEPKRGGF